MDRIDTLSWREFDADDLPALTGLAEACLAADGGLPLFARPPLLRARLLQTRTLAAWHGDSLVAAIGVGVPERPDATTDATARPATATGIVHPDWRGRGLGTRLLSWASEHVGDADLVVTTESWSPGADRLFIAHGLHETFAESVLRHDLTALPAVALPDGLRTEPVTPQVGPDLFATYHASFADRPGFAAPTAEEWLGDLADDDEYRPDLSLLARDPDGEPVGFVNVIGAWIDQVGVVPAWRKRRVGAYLVAAALRSLAADDARDAWLCVNDDNPAGALYRRLGFADAGRRARYLLRRR
ncbi:GNAT family N-acetyltransferase [Micromonospora echinaurantiaca]|uniref:GNAT family N-acetyltransferase n=1 Tax=Micromonospora echinaurantiaca TaxID=47857 RepID=UPI003421FED3